MRRFAILIWRAISVFIFLSLVGAIVGGGWYARNEAYLQGFSDALISKTASPEEKVAQILEYFGSHPKRGYASKLDDRNLLNRDVTKFLNDDALLKGCGSSSATFVALARKQGVKARVLLLTNERHGAKHVVAEVYLDGRWVVVDPGFRALLRDGNGRLLTKEELRDAIIFRQATGGIAGYNPEYTYDRTGYIRFEKIPIVGKALRRLTGVLFRRPPEEIPRPRFLDRSELVVLYLGVVGIVAGVILHIIWGHFVIKRHFGIRRLRLRERVLSSVLR